MERGNRRRLGRRQTRTGWVGRNGGRKKARSKITRIWRRNEISSRDGTREERGEGRWMDAEEEGEKEAEVIRGRRAGRDDVMGEAAADPGKQVESRK